MTDTASAPERIVEIIDYVLQDEEHNRLVPRVIDIAYSAFMSAKRPNKEDGSASDWFNDTRPTVIAMIEAIATKVAPLSQAMTAHCDELVAAARAEGAREAQEKIARLTEALEFYADDNRAGLPSDGPWGLGSNDFGIRARAALQENANG